MNPQQPMTKMPGGMLELIPMFMAAGKLPNKQELTQLAMSAGFGYLMSGWRFSAAIQPVWPLVSKYAPSFVAKFVPLVSLAVQGAFIYANDESPASLILSASNTVLPSLAGPAQMGMLAYYAYGWIGVKAAAMFANAFLALFILAAGAYIYKNYTASSLLAGSFLAPYFGYRDLLRLTLPELKDLNKLQSLLSAKHYKDFSVQTVGDTTQLMFSAGNQRHKIDVKPQDKGSVLELQLWDDFENPKSASYKAIEATVKLAASLSETGYSLNLSEVQDKTLFEVLCKIAHANKLVVVLASPEQFTQFQSISGKKPTMQDHMGKTYGTLPLATSKTSGGGIASLLGSMANMSGGLPAGMTPEQMAATMQQYQQGASPAAG